VSQRRALPIVVTGATGFVGRHVRSAIAERGLAAALITRRPVVATARENLIALGVDTRLDRIQPPRLPDHFSLIHLAWEGLPHYGSERHIDEELPAQIDFVASAVRAGARRLVIAGTCFEYGDVAGPVSESFPCCPSTRYGEAKVRLSAECLRLASDHQVELVWLRVFFPYGPGQRADSLYGQLASHHASRHSQPFELRSPHRALDFIAIDEVAATLVDAALFGSEEPILNVGSGRPRTVYEQACRIVAENQWSVDLRVSQADVDQPSDGFWADTRRLQSWRDRLNGGAR